MAATITIAGVVVTSRVRVQGLTIHDVLNDAPNTCSFVLEGAGPAVGQAVRITWAGTLLFAGQVQTIDQAYEGRPSHLAWRVTAIDDSAIPWRPFGTWVDTSATTIAQAITATYALGFTATGVEAGLPLVSIVFDGSETFIACLARLATAVAGYCKIEDRVVYLFTEDTTAPPDPIDDAHRFLHDPPITINTDMSQLRTRVYGKGYGEQVQADLVAGASQIPIEDGALFEPLGGGAIIGRTADGAQSDVIAYAGVDRGGAGSLVGTGAAPGHGPGLEPVAGAGVESGVHGYAIVYVTGTGPYGTTLPGPQSTITVGTHAPPATAPTAGAPTTGTGPDEGWHEYAAAFVTSYGETVAGAISNAITTSATSGQLPTPGLTYADNASTGTGLPDGYHEYATTFVNATGETPPGPPSVAILTQPPTSQIHIFVIPTGPAGTTARKLYRRDGIGGVGIFKYLVTIPDNTTTSHLDTKPTLGADAPTVNTTGTAVQRVPVTSIPIGPPGVTQRKLYRRFNGAGPFKLVTTLANNTGTTFTDTVSNAALGAAALGTATAVANQVRVSWGGAPAAVTLIQLYRTTAGGSALQFLDNISGNVAGTYVDAKADAALGPAPPTSDTSGLTQPTGQVNPGSTVLPVASSGPFHPAGGWVILGGGQVVWHAAISGNFLIGIPASGSGAITTAVIYGQQAMPSPMLIGVTGLAAPIMKGAAVHLWIRRDDVLAQAEHAARTGDLYGVVEFLIVDARRGQASLTARCDADLALFSRPIRTVRYATRDLKTKSGKPIEIDLPSQRITGQTLTIQDVTITEIGIAGGLAPRFTVTASSVRFSLEDTLRRLVAVGPVAVHA